MQYVCAHISHFSKDCQCRSHVNSTCSSPKQEPVPELNSQRVIAGRNLENSLLKGRRSRLKQLQSYYDHNNCAVLCKACIVQSVVSLVLTCAALTPISY